MHKNLESYKSIKFRNIKHTALQKLGNVPITVTWATLNVTCLSVRIQSLISGSQIIIFILFLFTVQEGAALEIVCVL